MSRRERVDAALGRLDCDAWAGPLLRHRETMGGLVRSRLRELLVLPAGDDRRSREWRDLVGLIGREASEELLRRAEREVSQ